MRGGGVCVPIMRGREIAVEKRGRFDCEWVKVDHEASETRCCVFVEVRKAGTGGLKARLLNLYSRW